MTKFDTKYTTGTSGYWVLRSVDSPHTIHARFGTSTEAYETAISVVVECGQAFMVVDAISGHGMVFNPVGHGNLNEQPPAHLDGLKIALDAHSLQQRRDRLAHLIDEYRPRSIPDVREADDYRYCAVVQHNGEDNHDFGLFDSLEGVTLEAASLDPGSTLTEVHDLHTGREIPFTATIIFTEA